MKAKPKELRVYMSDREEACFECKAEYGKGELVFFERVRPSLTGRTLCLPCAGLDHLVYLPSGNHALTRRATANSNLRAVVYRVSKARKRSERQGVLVEKEALQKAEQECLSDEEARRRARERARARRESHNEAYIARFEEKISELFPGCPPEERREIAHRACEVGSGRVGRVESAKLLEDWPVEAAVSAHVRHNHTNYDEILWETMSREAARFKVKSEVEAKLAEWRGGG